MRIYNVACHSHMHNCVLSNIISLQHIKKNFLWEIVNYHKMCALFLTIVETLNKLGVTDSETVKRQQKWTMQIDMKDSLGKHTNMKWQRL